MNGIERRAEFVPKGLEFDTSRPAFDLEKPQPPFTAHVPLVLRFPFLLKCPGRSTSCNRKKKKEKVIALADHGQALAPLSCTLSAA